MYFELFYSLEFWKWATSFFVSLATLLAVVYYQSLRPWLDKRNKVDQSQINLLKGKQPTYFKRVRETNRRSNVNRIHDLEEYGSVFVVDVEIENWMTKKVLLDTIDFSVKDDFFQEESLSIYNGKRVKVPKGIGPRKSANVKSLKPGNRVERYSDTKRLEIDAKNAKRIRFAFYSEINIPENKLDHKFSGDLTLKASRTPLFELEKRNIKFTSFRESDDW